MVKRATAEVNRELGLLPAGLCSAIAAAVQIKHGLEPALRALNRALVAKSEAFAAFVKTGRTHIQDATPVTLGQEFSGYAAQIEFGLERIETALPGLYRLAQGGTAVGTGLINAKRGFDRAAAMTALPFVSAQNKFETLAAHDALLFAHGNPIQAEALTMVCTRVFGNQATITFADRRVISN